ncbi:zinc-binding dehydrogenase [Chryseobacterium sp.]|uniref:zinc-binding dehydrogenase n=1 Tax=Chryseobacterium sp. TaxID=1871047 RepID=UPI0025BF6C19|nr:zinc-binding dehydrogenase [Chryseobacterium sp.]MBV8325168.1 zinc-binding dehydrogenase [Chryseobacterium sp.]
MNPALEENHLKPEIDRSFPLSDFREAFNYLEKGKHFGKVVIRFSSCVASNLSIFYFIGTPHLLMTKAFSL